MGILVALLLVAIGCSDDALPVTDTGTPLDSSLSDADAMPDTTIVVDEPMPPAPPAEPMMTPCPTGWREVLRDDGTTVCDAWPDTGRATCGDAEAHFPGEPGCVQIGTACPPGDFPETTPAGRPVIYALAGARAGGADGSAGRPFPTIADALDAATSGDVIAVGKGRYEEELSVPDGIHLRGACVAETVITSLVPSVLEGTVVATGADVALSNLTIADSVRPGVSLASADATVTLEDVAVLRNAGYGIVLRSGGQLTARALVVRQTQPYPAGSPEENTSGLGMSVTRGGMADIERAVFEENHTLGVLVFATATLVASDVSVVATLPEPAAGFGAGLDCIIASRCELRRVVIEDNPMRGLGSAGAAELSLEDVIVRNTGLFGMGIFNESSSITARRLQIVGSEFAGVIAFGTTIALDLEDIVVEDTLIGPAVLFSASPESDATPVSNVRVERALVQNNPFGIQVDGESMLATLRDVTVRDNADTGLYLSLGASVEIERALVARNDNLGIIVTGPFLDEEDLGVARPGQYLPPSVRLTDVAIEDTRGRDGDTGTGGRGLHAQYGDVTGERIRIARNREVAVSTFAATLDLTDVAVIDTLPAACGDGCPVHAFGHGVIKGPTARIRLERFEVSRTPLCGLLTITPRQLTLAEGVVAENEIGVCAQGSVDLGLLARDVIYRDNTQNLDTTMLPIPPLQITD